MVIMGIDPGNLESGVVWVEDGILTEHGIYPNAEVLQFVKSAGADWLLAVEWINAMGMAVGKEVFETCLWAGRFGQAAPCPVRYIPRTRVKLHHCGSSTANDGNVARALRDKYGQKGTKASPGYFFGVKEHEWQAFAVAAYALEGASHASELRVNRGDELFFGSQTESKD